MYAMLKHIIDFLMAAHIQTLLLWIMAITALAWMSLEIRHTDRFGKDRGPMHVRIRNFFMWTSAVEALVLTFWETQHGIVHWP